MGLTKSQIIWKNVFILSFYHAIALHGVFYIATGSSKWETFVFHFIIGRLGTQGITAGVHRLWCHRAYKAKLPLRVFLCFLQTFSFQTCIYEWCKDHRVHHKFSDTDADPYNITRGFFFAHMGWVMVRKHPDVIKFGKTVDVSDLLEDPVVRFQKKYYAILAPLCAFVLPTLVPWYYWNEDLYKAFAVGMVRYMLSLHVTWLVNSAAHMWGMRPYDSTIKPVENPLVSRLTQGEGWHNYHHAFPWDYKASELGSYGSNLSTAFIDLMAKIGLAYDLRTASKDMVKRRKERTGSLELKSL